MPEKQGMLEDAEDMVLQAPRDTAKARLPESQSPVVEPHTYCDSVYAQYPRSGSFGFRDPLPPPGGAMENDSIQGYDQDAYVALTSSRQETEDCLRGATPMVTETP